MLRSYGVADVYARIRSGHISLLCGEEYPRINDGTRFF